MNFGHFDDARREYVITTPKTPQPWINYLGSKEMFGIISNTAGGYSFYRDAKLRRITRYRYNNIPIDSNGRYFYLKTDGEIWSPTWQPVRAELDHYECRHGLGYTTIAAEKQGIGSEITYFVPVNDNVEIHRVRLTNTTNQAKSVDLFSYAEFCLWNADEDDRNFQRNLNIGEVEVDGTAVFHKTEYRERRNHYAYYRANRAIKNFETSREEFVGTYGTLAAPEAVVAGHLKGTLASGWSPIASHQLAFDLAPGQTEEIIFTLGYVEVDESEKFSSPHCINKTPAKAQWERYDSPDQVAAALSDLAADWDNILAPFQIECTDEKLARMVNIWNPYQCMVTFNLSRSASYFESGIGRGMGFRDSNQDLLGFVHQAPERARQRILDIAATQLPDGGAFHQYQPLTKRGNSDIGTNFNDDPLWLISGVCGYIKETGDLSILKETVDFENDPALAAPLLDHLFRSFNFTLNNLGPHSLPLIGRADWNDCLNLNCFSEVPGEPFQTTNNKMGRTAESLMIAGLFIHASKEFSQLLGCLEQNDDAAKVLTAAEEMEAAINTSGRDPEWFLRAYDYYGDKIGSQECEEGKIYIESQGWCIMAGVGLEDGFAVKALDAVDKHLGTEHGIVLQDPPYSEYHLNLGEVSSYPRGYKENGGIFCHTNPWIMIAETLVGRADKAFDYYTRICPAYREDQSEVHRMEPYVYSQMIAGKTAPRHGEAKNSWLTGTAAWNYVAITQYILGIQPTFAGLCIIPCYPAELGEIKVTRHLRGTLYSITMIPSKGDKKLVVNGETLTPETEIQPVGDTLEITVHF